MADKYPIPQDQAFADCWLKYGGQVKAVAKALTSTAQYGKITPERVRQNIRRIARLGRLPLPDVARIEIAKALAKNKGNIARIPPDILAAAAGLGIDPQHFQSSWPARSKPDPNAPDCPHCGLSDRVRKRSDPKVANYWRCLACGKHFSWPKNNRPRLILEKPYLGRNGM
jgi:hypothetical protein